MDSMLRNDLISITVFAIIVTLLVIGVLFDIQSLAEDPATPTPTFSAVRKYIDEEHGTVCYYIGGSQMECKDIETGEWSSKP